MGKNRRTSTISKFTCTKCNNIIYLPRKKGKEREKNHLKKIYCITCKEIINHSETRDIDFY